MQIINSCAAILAAAVLLTGCGNTTSPLAACWQVNAINMQRMLPVTANEEFMEQQLQNGYLRLYNNNRYIFINYGNSAQGRWKFEQHNGVLVLDSFISSQQVQLQVTGPTGNRLSLKFYAINNKRAAGRCVINLNKSTAFEYNGHNLLTPELNNWRIKPHHKETDAEIKERVKGSLTFGAEYFKMLVWNKAVAIEPGYLQSEIQLYQHGFGLPADSAAIKTKWLLCFYDSEDALRGRRLLAHVMDNMGPFKRGDNYGDEYRQGFLQLLATLEKMK